MHYLEKDDAVYRSILQCSQNMRDFNIQPELYFRTTQEMLDAFSWLGEEKAYEIVVTNTNNIADLIEKTSLYPKHPENKTTFAPVWDNDENEVLNMALARAHELYGDELPEIVEKGLKKSLIP